MADDQDITQPLESPTPLGESPAPKPHSQREAEATIASLITEKADAVPAAPSPASAPVNLQPNTTAEGRIVNSLAMGRVDYGHDDVEQVRDRLTPDEYQQLHRAVAQRDYLRGEEEKLRAAVPEWKDTARGRAEIAQLAAFLRTEYGVTNEQIAAGFLDSRVIILARDAMRARSRDQEAPTVGRRASRKTGGHVHGTAPGERLNGTPSASAAIRALME
jgi:hypothetical protein